MTTWRISLFLVVFAAILPFQSHAQEISYWEDFALATDREAVLKKLIPGTQEYYFYHCLHHQNMQQFEKVDDMLQKWIKRHGRNSLVREIQNRQALMMYSIDPKKSLEYIRNELNLNFHHQKEIPATERKLPSELDPRLVSEETLEKIARSRHSNTDGFEDRALFALAQKTLSDQELRHLLQRLQHPDVPGLVELVNRDLNERDSRGFGSMNIHRQMTVDQLEALVKLRPKTLNETNFVNFYLTKLRPNDDVNLALERDEHEQYLKRLWVFASRLAPVHNSLKANVIYHQLDLQRRAGVYDKELFLEYLKYPRNAFYVNPRYVEKFRTRGGIVNLSANYFSQTMLEPIGNDELLVREFLHRLLKDATNTKEFDDYVNNEYLKDRFAETKIVNGVGNQEQWASMLEPEEFRQLMERVDIDFSLTNPSVYDIDQGVKLEVAIKNVENLIVKIFEINTHNYYRTYQREINTDINLDGLVPNHELKFSYDEPPLRRVNRTFELPQLDKAGVYVVDFIGNGQSSRALIRKGSLQYMSDTTVAGQVFTITNRKGEQIQDATIHVGGRQYEADKDGFILLPFSTQPTRENIIICHGDLCSFDTFYHQSENYSLVAGFYVDRESLLQGKKAKVVVRPALRLNGIPALADVLTEVKLTVIATDLDGINSRAEYSNLKVENGVDLVQEFQVPARLNQLQFQLTAKVKNLSRDKEENLSASQQLKINEIDKQMSTHDVFLVGGASGYKLSVRGKNGEPREKQAVQIALKHENYRNEVSVVLQSDDEGNITLGKLPGIKTIRAVLTGQTRLWSLEGSRQNLYSNIQVAEGSPVMVPLASFVEGVTRDQLALFELRSNTVVDDAFEKMSIVDNVLVIKDLERGDYQLVIKEDNREVSIRVVEGEKKAGFVIGKNRTLELRQQSPMRISDVIVEGDELQIELGGVNDTTRVHVIATHFMPRFDAFKALSVVQGVEPQQITNPFRPSIYIEGRDIGDEYRYILDRKYAEKFPGNMLSRPSMLLNPWAVRETQNNQEVLQGGTEFGQGDDARGSRSGRADSKPGGTGYLIDESSLDFLDLSSAIAWNLKPDADGKIVIEKGALEGKQHIRVIVENHTGTVSTDIVLESGKPNLRDIRLAKSIDQDAHFTLNKEISVVKPDEEIEINSLLASRMQTYDDLSDIYEFYLSKTNDSKLKEFQFILKWSSYDENEKRKWYSKYACHELNVFLYYKDRAFYDSVVNDYLKNKKDATFVDHWLVKSKLDKYTDPWDHAHLNVAERIFLGHRQFPERAARHISDLYALNPTDRQYFDALFEAAIAGDALDTKRNRLLEEKSKEIRMIDPQAPPAAKGANAAGAGRSAGRDRGRAEGNRFRGGESADGIAPGNQPNFGVSGKDSDGENKKMDRSFDKAKSDRFQPDPSMDLEQAERSRRSLARKNSKNEAELQDELKSLEKLAEDESDQLYRYGRESERLLRLRQQTQALYRRVEATKEWAENNYYHLTLAQQDANLISANRFWLAFAEHKSGDGFLSIYFPEACRNFSEMMFALAVLDLPFEGKEHEYDFVDNTMTFKAKAKSIVLHQQVKPAIFERRGSNVLVSENFFKNNDRYRYEDNQRYDKFVTKDFIAGELYGSQIVITNPTSTPREIDLLIQIPQGAIPVNNSQQTRNLQLNLNAYSTQTFEYYFYFPAIGQYEHYPAHVSMEQRVLAVAEASTFNVIAQPNEIDQTSWAFVSQNGSNDEVIRFLNDNNVQRLDLSKIAFRMKDEAMYKRILQVLSDRFRFDQTLWSYAIYHNDTKAIADFLDHESRIANQSGAVVESEILSINPTDRFVYQHLEYMPLVNARSHQVGKTRKILNPQFHSQYHQLMRWLSYKNELDSSDRMAVTYYLMLQDRVSEALMMFDSVSKNELVTALQYDYCDAYLAMYRSQPDRAASIASKYEKYPVDRWREAFGSVTAQVKEIQGAKIEVVNDDSRDEKQTQLAASDSTFDLKVESRKVALQYQNTKQVKVNYYEMDIELLFSRNPFIDDYSQGFSMIKPNESQVVELPEDKKELIFDLPERFHNSNVLVEVVAGEQVKSQAYYAHSLAVQMSENYGHIKVGHQASGKVLPSTYVKVYAQMNDGSVKFWKDGYTDLRGRFDYVSLSNQPLDNVQRFSTLILNDDHGAIVRTAAPPKE